MSYLGAKTKKVTVYGRKKAQIISIHTDLDSPAKENVAPGSTLSTSRSISPTTPLRRAPLTSKPSQSYIPTEAVLQGSIEKAKTKAKGRAVAVPSKTETSKIVRKPISAFTYGKKGNTKKQPIVVEDDSSSSEEEEEEEVEEIVERDVKVPINSSLRGITSMAKSTSIIPSRSIGGDSEDEEEAVIVMRPHTKARRRGRAVIPSTPSSYAPTPRKKQTQILDCVEIPIFTPIPRQRIPRRAIRRAYRGLSLESVTDLTNRVADISISSNQTLGSSVSKPKSIGLEDLLKLCDTEKVQPWSELLGTILGREMAKGSTAKEAAISKVGEASYSEVYGVATEGEAGIVMKVIPLLSGTIPDSWEDIPDCSSIEEVVREITITKRMGEMSGGGFVEFIKASVVQGEYSELLLQQWDNYKSKHGTYSSRPGCFDLNQQYCVIELVNHGLDLESYRFDSTSGWLQAAGVFFQVTNALALAEAWTNFEHRDLHEGQILITPIDSAAKPSNFSSPSSTGVQATIIDFGLSRLQMPQEGEVSWSSLPEEVFEGKGEQWDVYRRMRDVIKGDWKGSHLATNVLWLQYLVNYLLTRSGIRKPKSPPTTSASPTKFKRGTTKSTKTKNLHSAETDLKKRSKEAYDTLLQIKEALDYAVEAIMAEAQGKEVRVKRGAKVLGQTKFGSAGDVAAWCKYRGLL